MATGREGLPWFSASLGLPGGAPFNRHTDSQMVEQKLPPFAGQQPCHERNVGVEISREQLEWACPFPNDAPIWLILLYRGEP
jgi:hypothetical protein